MKKCDIVARTLLGLLTGFALPIILFNDRGFGVQGFQSDKVFKSVNDKFTTTAIATYQPSIQGSQSIQESQTVIKHLQSHKNDLTSPKLEQQLGAPQTTQVISGSVNTPLENGPKRHLRKKIKDARHRRRQQRHNRHRHHRRQQPVIGSRSPSGSLLSREQMQQFNQFQAMMDNQRQQQQSQRPNLDKQASSALTALESIVEEVTRAGQQLVVNAASSVASSQQTKPVSSSTSQSPQQTSSSNPGGQDLLLDGSAAPVIQVKAGPAQQATNQAHGSSYPAQSNIQQTPASPQTQIQPISHHPLTGSRSNPLNSNRFFLTSMLSKIMNVLNVTEFAMEMRDGISSRASCMACNAVVGLFLSPLYSKEVFSAAIRTVCTSFKIQSSRVCSGLAESFQDDLEYIRKNTKLSRDEVCGVVFGIDCARRPTYNLFWTVPIPLMPNKLSQPQQPQSQPSNQGTTSSGDSIFIGMDDAPDLFEYRRSNQAATNWSNTTSNTSPQQSNNFQNIDKLNKAESHLANNQRDKSARMLKRPDYIFDDQGIDSNNNNDGSSSKDNKISTFVQLTDIHIDPYYEAGSLSDCKEPLCCRASSGMVQPGDKRRQAGRWGDYGNCDLPVRTLENALNRIRSQHPNAEYWLWTGDISPHDIWNISKSEAASHVRLVTKMIREYSNGLPVFPVIGNHEAHPVNSFSPPGIKGRFSMSWLYDLLADEWSDWLPKDAQDTLKIGGYYKLQVRKGFRIIALNTNYCARLNPWSFYDPVDPADQLKWLVDELLEAELNQDKVHLIGHVPPDNRECTQAWLFNFINIVDRFKDTIEAQFYGHTHRDEFRVMYSLRGQGDEPIGIQFIGPSLTPFTENNPAYRIYHQDRTGHLMDAETYFFNLTEANSSPLSEPKWQFAYSANAHLNMSQGLAGNDWHNYVQRLYDDIDLFDTFFKNFYRSSDVKVDQVCRNKCRHQILSDLRLLHPYKTKPKPFLANRRTSNHNHHNHHHHHHQLHQHLHKRHRHTERADNQNRAALTMDSIR